MSGMTIELVGAGPWDGKRFHLPEIVGEFVMPLHPALDFKGEPDEEELLNCQRLVFRPLGRIRGGVHLYGQVRP